MKKATKKATKKAAKKKVTMTEAKAAFNACIKARHAHSQAIKKFHDLWNKAIRYNPQEDSNPVIKFFDEHEYDVI